MYLLHHNARKISAFKFHAKKKYNKKLDCIRFKCSDVLRPIIQIKGLSIYQGNRLVLKNLNFTIYQGEFVFLIGKTGSGKSSLLKTLYGELPCRFGKVHVAEFLLHHILADQLPFLRRKLGIIFQDFQLLMDRTVEENLVFVLQATGWKKRIDIKNRIEKVLGQVDLLWAGKKMPYQLSGGEQQRIAIARALLNEPLVLLADEPTGNLDPEVANGIFNLFTTINQSGTAVLMATHNYDFLEKNNSRVLKCENEFLMDSWAHEEYNKMFGGLLLNKNKPIVDHV